MISGNNVLIGAPYDNTNGQTVGQAHLFDGVTGNLPRTFDDPTPTSEFGGDIFGWSVALDGNNVLIGASYDDTVGFNVGQAHLFTVPYPGDTGGTNDLSSFGQTYTQDFEALGSSSAGRPLPIGWSTDNAGTINTETTDRFRPASVTTGTYNAGREVADRTLATGNTDREAANAIRFTGSLTGPVDVWAVVLETRIEAFHGDYVSADDPGEAAFVISLLLDAEQDGTFSTAHTFNDGAPVTLAAC